MPQDGTRKYLGRTSMMSSHDGNHELRSDGERRKSRTAKHADADKPTVSAAKDEVVARIKHNFYLETQAFRKRILDATEETARARERVDSVQDEMLRMKKKCYKLKKLVQEKDATIQFLQEQQEVKFPIMMSETMRNIHLHLGNNQEDDFQQTVRLPGVAPHTSSTNV